MYYILTLVLPFALCDDPVIEDLKRPLPELGEGCGYDGCPYIKEDMLNVHIVPHTHGEMGYTRTFHQHYTGEEELIAPSNVNYKRILDHTISELWAKEDRKFTLSDTPYLFHWWANRDATVRRMVYQLLRQGRLHIVGSGWGMVDESCTSYHGIIDQMTHSLRKLNGTFSYCGRPLVAWQADVFGHSREFASLTAMAAFDGLFVSPISYEDELARMNTKSLEMLWRGSDDLGPNSDIFTHKLFDGYWSPPGFCFGSICNDPLIVTSDSAFNNVDERVNTFLEAVKNRQAPHYATNHIMVVMGKRHGYYDASIWFENIDVLINKVNEKSYKDNLKVHLMYSAPACYLHAVHKSNPALPVKQDDFVSVSYDKKNHFVGIFTSRPTIKYMVREGHVYLQISKQLQVLARLPHHNMFFEDFNWIMGALQDHNVITGAMRPHVKNYYTHKIYVAVQRSTLLLKKAFNKLRDSPSGTIYYRCPFNVSSCRNTNNKRSFVVIYNPLAWPVTVPVRIPIVRSKNTVFNPKLQTVKSVMMKIPAAVMRIPSRKTSANHEIVFMAENLPPMGYRSYYIEKEYSEPKRRRSIIKKLNKNRKKKYLTHQKNHLKIDDKSLLDKIDDDLDYYDENTVKPSPSPVFLNDNNDTFHDNMYITTEREAYFVKESDAPDSREYDDTKKEIVDYTSGTVSSTRTSAAARTTASTSAAFNTLLDEDPDSDENLYYYRVSPDKFIGNKYLTVNLDEQNHVTHVNLSNGVEIALKVEMYYFASDEPKKLGRDNERQPGPYIFKPMDQTPVLINESPESSVHKTELVQEVHWSSAHWASFTLRVYEERPIINLDWVVGPIPVDDFGKDVFIRYSTDLVNEGVFYTDSNGRQTVKRIRNDRPMYDPTVPDSIPGNYYPVTSKIYIEDIERNIRLSVFNDRSQGGTSLDDGQIDLMVHRRLATDDASIITSLNETEAGKGIVVRGTHYLYITKADYKPNRIFEKKFAKEIELAPQMLASPNKAYGDNSKEIWYGHNNEFTGLNRKLPVGVHVLTLESWNEGTLLLRLENYLEKSDVVKSGLKTVLIRSLFTNITIDGVRETTLGGNVWLGDWVPLQWNTKERFVKSFNEFYRGNGSVEFSEDDTIPYKEVDIKKGITLMPQQIRTFVVWFRYHY